MREACSTRGIGERYIQNFCRKLWKEETIWRPRFRWEDNIQMNLKEIVCEDVYCIRLVSGYCPVAGSYGLEFLDPMNDSKFILDFTLLHLIGLIRFNFCVFTCMVPLLCVSETGHSKSKDSRQKVIDTHNGIQFIRPQEKLVYFRINRHGHRRK
jgi:hypothetical protein